MIKFFRHIRKSLLMENKTGKYFKYAIGEILLVVIGILIAVQINTWNQNRNRLQLESVLLDQLKDELTEIYSDLNGDYTILKLGRESNYRIEDYIDKDLPYNNNLSFDFYLINIDEYIYPKAAVYDKLKEEGLDIISNDTIRYLTRAVYESLFPRISRGNPFNPDISEFFKEYYHTNFKPNKDYSLQFMHIIPSDTLGSAIYQADTISYPITFSTNGIKRKYTIGYHPLNFEALKKDAKFHMLLKQTTSFRDYKVGRYQMTKERVKELVRRIDIELKNKND